MKTKERWHCICGEPDYCEHMEDGIMNAKTQAHTPTCKKETGKQAQFDMDCQRCNKDSYDAVTALRPAAEKFFATQSPTPTPWHLKELTKDGYIVIGPLRKVGVAMVLKENAKDAAFIVRAVNAHEELVAALENVVDDLNFDGTFTAEEILKTVEIVRSQIRQTIAKADGADNANL